MVSFKLNWDTSGVYRMVNERVQEILSADEPEPDDDDEQTDDEQTDDEQTDDE